MKAIKRRPFVCLGGIGDHAWGFADGKKFSHHLTITYSEWIIGWYVSRNRYGSTTSRK